MAPAEAIERQPHWTALSRVLFKRGHLSGGKPKSNTRHQQKSAARMLKQKDRASWQARLNAAAADKTLQRTGQTAAPQMRTLLVPVLVS
eukprot:1161277-Pelagomonas_calceolata.AAC.7